MAVDYLEFADIKRAIETGRIRRKFTRDPRGRRYEIVGRSTDEREIGVGGEEYPGGGYQGTESPNDHKEPHPGTT